MMAVVTSLAVSYIILSVQNLRLSGEEDYTICASLGIIRWYEFIQIDLNDNSSKYFFRVYFIFRIYVRIFLVKHCFF